MVTDRTTVFDDLVHAYRKRAVARLEWACGWPPDQAVSERHPRYQIVTEGRDLPTPGYSSCADLAHDMYFRLGVRAAWINRAEHRGWRPGVNVSRLTAHSAPYRGASLEGGDVILIWNRADTADAHVVCIVDQHDDLVATAEYGQPGGALKECRLREGRLQSRRKDGSWSWGRKVQRLLPLANVLAEGPLVDVANAEEDLPTRPGTPEAIRRSAPPKIGSDDGTD